MSTLGERIRIIRIKSGLQLPQYAESLGVSKETLIHYQKDRRYPNSVFLSNLCKIYQVNPTWLLLGEGNPVSGNEGKSRESECWVGAIDPVVQLLSEEEARAGITLIPEQRTAILKILRELVDRDVRSIRELLSSIQGAKQKEDD